MIDKLVTEYTPLFFCMLLDVQLYIYTGAIITSCHDASDFWRFASLAFGYHTDLVSVKPAWRICSNDHMKKI